MIIPEREETLISIIYCQKCQKYYSEQTGNMKISCAVNHAPGDCCHYGDKEVTKEFVAELMEKLKK